MRSEKEVLKRLEAVRVFKDRIAEKALHDQRAKGDLIRLLSKEAELKWVLEESDIDTEKMN